MPYSSQPKSAFWRTCREAEEFLSKDLFRPAHELTKGARIATAGSCFAQHIGRYIKHSELAFVDTEAMPHGMAEDVAKRFSFDLFSARYGNIYTARQLRQLLTDCVTGDVHDAAIWTKGARIFDGLRPNVEPNGFASADEMRAHRRDHLFRVREIFDQADVFVFTLGLTELWQDTETGLAFPSAPGVIAGTYDANRHSCVNLSFSDVWEDLSFAIELMRDLAPEIRILLTVSPVPLTATATDAHVLAATTYSKSVLRAVAGQMAMTHDFVEYFPSYELITGAPFAAHTYEPNLRSVRQAAVDRVMSVFFGAYPTLSKPDFGIDKEIPPRPDDGMEDEDALICEDLMLEMFADR